MGLDCNTFVRGECSDPLVARLLAVKNAHDKHSRSGSKRNLQAGLKVTLPLLSKAFILIDFTNASQDIS